MATATALSYPAHREADVALRDGSTVHVRPARAGDEAALLGLLRGLSADSIYFRFFSGAPNLSEAASRAVDLDYHDRYGLLALSGIKEEVVGHAMYVRTGRDRAEVAFAIADQMQGHGLGTILLGHLAEAAQEAGIHLFEASVLAGNARMLQVFRESGFRPRFQAEAGVVMVEFPAWLSADAIERFEAREQVAAANALRNLLNPRSVAVIGASRRRKTIGGEVLHNLLEAGFQGPVYPVNPQAPFTQSVVAYPSVLKTPGPVDLAVIVVPAEAVVEVARECALKGVRSMVVISAGFAEAGPEGALRQRELLVLCRKAGIRLVGPNCMGVINTSPEVLLDATFGPAFPPRGRVGFLSQSGALGLAVIDYAASLGLGLSWFVAVGNKADISGNDIIQFYESDPDTDLLLLYLESFGNPRKFARLARRVGRKKPIVAVKSGRSVAGARATSSHTGALLAASDATVDALFQQAGVIRTNTLAELYDVASLLANQPLPKGRRVVILTNAGGPGILCADACEAEGLRVVELPEQVRAQLKAFLPAEASAANPIDMIASATAEDYKRVIERIASADAADAVIVIFIPPLVTEPEAVGSAIREAAAGLKVPVLAVFMSSRGVPPSLQSAERRIPSYAFPEDAARALALAVRYQSWLARPAGKVTNFDGLRRDEAAAIIAGALAEGRGWLGPDEVNRLLRCYQLPLVETRIMTSPAEAGASAEDMHGPVALKVIAPGLIHKTEAHAVALGLLGREQVESRAREMQEDVTAAGHQVQGFLVQKMAPAGVEMLVGVVHDPLFGPILACAGGGITAELLKDVSIRITPVTDVDAAEMVRSLKSYPLLRGYRGSPPADVESLHDVLQKISSLVEAHPEIAEMDCNPVIVHPNGAVIVDARIRVEVAAPQSPLGATRGSVPVA